MKKSFNSILLAIGLSIFSNALAGTASAQIDAVTATNLLNQASSSGDTKLSGLASELTTKSQALQTSVGTNSAVSTNLSGMMSSLTSGKDSSALTSAFNLSTAASAAKLTTNQVTLAKQVGNVASAYVVQKNFSSLTGSQGDVANLVNSLRTGSLTSAAVPLKNIASNASLTASQKQLITSVGNQYAPGLSKLGNSVSSLKKLF